VKGGLHMHSLNLDPYLHGNGSNACAIWLEQGHHLTNQEGREM
jgi:hypothetical protein